MIYLGNKQIGINQLTKSNPNWVETIEGTIANPWGNVEPATLYTELSGNAVSILLTAPVGNNTVTLPIVADAAGILRRFKAVTAVDYNEGLQTYTAAYDDSGTLSVFVRATALSDNGSIDDLTSVASGVPTTLTIIHHPLPPVTQYTISYYEGATTNLITEEYVTKGEFPNSIPEGYSYWTLTQDKHDENILKISDYPNGIQNDMSVYGWHLYQVDYYNGVTQAYITQEDIIEGDSLNAPQGYDHWTTDDTGNIQFDINSSVTSHLILYGWPEKYSVQYYDGPMGQLISEEEVFEGEIPGATPSGYDYWTTDDNGGTVIDLTNHQITGDSFFYGWYNDSENPEEEYEVIWFDGKDLAGDPLQTWTGTLPHNFINSDFPSSYDYWTTSESNDPKINIPYTISDASKVVYFYGWHNGDEYSIVTYYDGETGNEISTEEVAYYQSPEQVPAGYDYWTYDSAGEEVATDEIGQTDINLTLQQITEDTPFYGWHDTAPGYEEPDPEEEEEEVV